MESPYIVEMQNEGCSQCGHDAQYAVVYVPEQIGQSQTWGDREEAEHIVDMLNEAFERGGGGKTALVAEAANMLALLKKYADNDPCAPNDPRYVEAREIIARIETPPAPVATFDDSDIPF
jgi:hypothetical protein